MYEAVTRAIRVCVTPRYSAERSDPDENEYFWTYRIDIANEGTETVRLESRYWRITDERGRVEDVRGAGVVGETPLLAPGATFTYTSGCPLSTPSGIMVGQYFMITEAGERFAIAIPAFSLDCPTSTRSMN